MLNHKHADTHEDKDEENNLFFVFAAFLKSCAGCRVSAVAKIGGEGQNYLLLGRHTHAQSSATVMERTLFRRNHKWKTLS